MHRSQIVLGVLKVILRRNPVAAQRFGASQRQITLVVSLGVLRLGIWAVEPSRFGLSDLPSWLGSHVRRRSAAVALNSKVVVMSVGRANLSRVTFTWKWSDAVDGVMRSERL